MAVGVVYDPRMCAHKDPFDNYHPEQPSRITAIWECLAESGVLDRCVRIDAREATVEELASVHTEPHIEKMCSVSSRTYGKQGRAALARRYNSIYFNEGSSESALLAAGSVVELSLRVARGELSSGAAIVRPPGHHAEADEAMGFCLFNNVAVAAQILAGGKVAGSHKVLIVDWDVHHGNGTQHMFWQDPSILYFSVHRYDSGFFYPVGHEGNYDKIGGGAGAGFNINVPWPRGGYGDADYLAVWDHVLLPVAREFNPDIVLISGGFDSAQGDPLGGCNLTPPGYSIMTQKLMELAGGKLVLALEGGYNLQSISQSYLACVQTLLGDASLELDSNEQAFESTWSIIEKVRQELSGYWPVLSSKVEKSAGKSSPLKEVDLFESSEDEAVATFERDLEEVSAKLIEAEKFIAVNQEKLIQLLNGPEIAEDGEEEVTKPEIAEDGEEEVVIQETLGSVEDFVQSSENTTVPLHSEVSCSSSTYVWYATFGSNMWPNRLMGYIQGGKVEGANAVQRGLIDKTPPKDNFWFTAPHRLFFGREGTVTWGSGGVAFLNPMPSTNGEEEFSFFRAYKITLQQFNGIFLGENRLYSETQHDLLSLDDIEALKQPPYCSNLMKGTWYGTVLYLGEKEGLPIMTITCSAADAESYKAGEFPLLPPSAPYQNVICKGLLEKGDMSEEAVLQYLAARIAKPLS